MRIGRDNLYGFVSNSEESGLPLAQADVIDMDTFASLIGNDDVQIVDVRAKTEYSAAHIAGAEPVFAGTIPANLEKISKDRTVVIHCQTGDRATIAYSLLKRNGFARVKNCPGGMKEWNEKPAELFHD